MADAGWYSDPSDATNERYWDGSAWTASTRAATAPGVPQPSTFTPTDPQTVRPGYAMGGHGALGHAVPMNAALDRRFVALLIDTAVTFGPLMVGYAVMLVMLALAASRSGDLSGVLGLVGGAIALVAVLWSIGFTVYNTIIRQGRTGQTIGKSRVGLRLVRDSDLQPLGPGTAVVRWFVPFLLSNATCGIFGIVDCLFPLWEPNRKRLTDKWLNFSVVPA